MKAIVFGKKDEGQAVIFTSDVKRVEKIYLNENKEDVEKEGGVFVAAKIVVETRDGKKMEVMPEGFHWCFSEFRKANKDFEKEGNEKIDFLDFLEKTKFAEKKKLHFEIAEKKFEAVLNFLVSEKEEEKILNL